MPSTVFMRIPNWLTDEISVRMDEKLSIIKMIPGRIWQRGADADVLLKRYSSAQLFISEKELQYPFFKKCAYKLLGKSVPQLFAVGTSSEKLKFDFIWSNLELSRLSPKDLVPEWKKYLAPNALLMFSYLGPDTGKNLQALLGLERIVEYSSWDMHDVGDVLLQEGFSEPVMDMEYLTLDYKNRDLLVKDALLLGLITAEEFDQVSRQSSLGGAECALQITLELVYGHAWTPELNLSRAKDGLASISPDQIVRPKK